MGLTYNATTGEIEYLVDLEDENGGGGGGDVEEIPLLSITTAPTGSFAVGSKYYNSIDKKIYTAVVADSWDGSTVEDPQFGVYYLYDNSTYIWDGDSLEKYNLEDFIPKTDIVNDLATDDATKVLSAKQGKILKDEVDLKQDKTDNNLETTSKTIVGAINEVNQSMIGVPDLIITENKTLKTPLFYNGRIIINSGVTITIDEPMKPLIIKCKKLVNNGTIDATGKGFQGKKVIYGEGVGYCNGDNVETTGSRTGGGAPGVDKPSAYRTMLGLASAVGGGFATPYGPGYDGTNGGGGGGGSDGGPLSGGGSGAGGGGGGAGHGLTNYPKGGNGSQADTAINLQLFKDSQLNEIPLFGASGAAGWKDSAPTVKDTSNGGGNIQIYANKIENNGIIRANGETVYLTSSEQNGGCGGAGGGCIMIRTANIINGTGAVIEAKGSEGHRYSRFQYGGNGGDGLILIDILDTNNVDNITLQNNENVLSFKTKTVNDKDKVWKVTNNGTWSLENIKEWKTVNTFVSVEGNDYTLYILTSDCTISNIEYKKGFYTWDSTNGYLMRSGASEVFTDTQDLVSITNPSNQTIYRVQREKYKHNNIDVENVEFYKGLGSTVITSTGISVNGGEEVEYINITSSDITSWIAAGYIEISDFSTANFGKYNNTDGGYDIISNFEETDVYDLYFNPTEITGIDNYILISSSDDVISYDSLSNKPKVNGETLTGNKTSADLKISREISEVEYEALSNEEKNNGTAYYIDAGGSSSNVNETNYNNLTNKPSINGVTLQQGQTANDLDIYTRSQIDAKMSGIFKYKGVVATINDLPSSTSKAGDCYYVTAETSTYAFNGSAWENIGSTVDLTNYQTSTDNSLETNSKTVVGAINELNADKVDISSVVDSLTSTATNAPLSANQGKVLNDKVELRELLSNKTTTIDNSSTDTEYPSAKAVYDGFAPISTSKYVSTFKSPNDCIVPFDFHRILNMANERATIEGLFVSQMTDPVDSSSNLFGDLKVRQQCYGGSTAGSATNICIEQTFETYLRGNPTQRKVFFRRGYLANSSNDIDINNVGAIKNSLTWMSWYPLEYPNIALTLDDTVIGANSKADLAVSGGIATIRFNNLNFKSNTGSSALRFDNDTKLNVLRMNKYQTTSTAGSYVWNTLISTDPTKTILTCSNPNLFVWGATANVGYYGLIIIPLGY